MPLIAGLAPDLGWKSLELFAEKALPRINEKRGARVRISEKRP
jgi:hypothetical protein